jgi:hypothetical protein
MEIDKVEVERGKFKLILNKIFEIKRKNTFKALIILKKKKE